MMRVALRLFRFMLVMVLGIALGWWLSQPAVGADADTYTVRAGETLSQIAEERGTTVQSLIALNEQRYPRLAESSGRFIVAGWELVVAPGGGEPRWRVVGSEILAELMSLLEKVKPTVPSLLPASEHVVVNTAPVANPTLDQIEATLVAQTNAARAEAGLPPLAADAALTALARQRSQDMIDRNYFSHHDPETGESMILPYCIQPLATNLCGENLAASSSLTDVQANVVARWIASEGHRANIMRPEFGRVGIGIAAGGKWGYVVTQLFAP